MSAPVETYLAKASVNGGDLHVLKVQATSEMAALRVARGFWPDSVMVPGVLFAAERQSTATVPVIITWTRAPKPQTPARVDGCPGERVGSRYA